jgi:glycosyltransferase involved in cell wall biosynthesis
VWSIVHVLSSFGVGGQERVALDLAIGQRARGHEVSVLSLAPPPDGPMAEEFERAGVAIGRVPKRPGIDPTLVPRLYAELRRRRAEVVHTHNPLPLIYGAPAARLARAAAIHTKHGANPGGRGQRLLRRTAAQLAHAFVAVSDTTAAQARGSTRCVRSTLRRACPTSRGSTARTAVRATSTFTIVSRSSTPACRPVIPATGPTAR